MLVALVVVAATACSGAATDSAVTTAGATVPTEAPASNDAPAPTGDAPADAVAPSPTTNDRVRPEGRDAPDFALALGQGGDFSLGSEAKPVYMVFWAEW